MAGSQKDGLSGLAGFQKSKAVTDWPALRSVFCHWLALHACTSLAADTGGHRRAHIQQVLTSVTVSLSFTAVAAEHTCTLREKPSGSRFPRFIPTGVGSLACGRRGPPCQLLGPSWECSEAAVQELHRGGVRDGQPTEAHSVQRRPHAEETCVAAPSGSPAEAEGLALAGARLPVGHLGARVLAPAAPVTGHARRRACPSASAGEPLGALRVPVPRDV